MYIKKLLIVVIILLLLALLLIVFKHNQLIETSVSLHNKIEYYLSKKNPNEEFEIIEYKKIKGVNPPTSQTKEPILINSWNYYKKYFISNDGRVIDYQRGSITTSEGQAYAMIRALRLKDKETFDKIYYWTKYNLQHKNDSLFAWLWGPKHLQNPEKIEYGILDQNGATDADAEIAASLILAFKLWEQQNYMEEAQKILDDVWDKETVKIKNERILVAGVNQKKAENIEINPSYFMLYSFRIFSEADKEHDWKKVLDSSYRLTNFCIDHIKSGLPPDIFYINRNTGAITFDKDKSDFSYDAIRVFYRFYIDYALTNDPRDAKLLSRSKLFINRWKKEGKFYTNYKQNGELKDYNQYIGSIALLLPVINMYDEEVAKEIYIKKIKKQYNNAGYYDDPINYYTQNLVWFGLWLYLNEKNIKFYKY